MHWVYTQNIKNKKPVLNQDYPLQIKFKWNKQGKKPVNIKTKFKTYHDMVLTVQRIFCYIKLLNNAVNSIYSAFKVYMFYQLIM